MKRRKIICAHGANAEQAAGEAFGPLVEAACNLPFGVIVAAIAGGRSTAPLWEVMAEASRAQDPDWRQLLEDLVFRPLDERIVAPENHDYNFNDLRCRLFDRLELRSDQVRWFEPQPDLPDGGVDLYNAEFTGSGGKVDIVIAAVGPRNAGAGHYGSVFADTLAAIGMQTGYVAVQTKDKQPPRRMTLGPAACSKAPIVVLVVSGGREDILADFAREGDPAECPARTLKDADDDVVDPVLIVMTWVSKEALPVLE